MRVVALFLGILLASTAISAAQCGVKCFQVSRRPPCHRQAPSQQAPVSQSPCDSVMLAGPAIAARTEISLRDAASGSPLAMPSENLSPVAPPRSVPHRRPAPLHSPPDAGAIVLRI